MVPAGATGKGVGIFHWGLKLELCVGMSGLLLVCVFSDLTRCFCFPCSSKFSYTLT